MARDPRRFLRPVAARQGGGIGINVGGTVHVKPLAEWHRLAGGPSRGLRPSIETGTDAPTPNEKLANLCEWAWSIIANASGGDWKKESPEWQEAAAKWRDEWHELPSAVRYESFGRAAPPAPREPTLRQSYVMAMAILQSDLFQNLDEELVAAVRAATAEGVVMPGAPREGRESREAPLSDAELTLRLVLDGWDAGRQALGQFVGLLEPTGKHATDIRAAFDAIDASRRQVGEAIAVLRAATPGEPDAALRTIISDDDIRVAVSDYLTTADLAPIRQLLRIAGGEMDVSERDADFLHSIVNRFPAAGDGSQLRQITLDEADGQVIWDIARRVRRMTAGLRTNDGGKA